MENTTNDWIIGNHLENFNNPHEVTKEQVGLGNVDNTSDADKPVSTAVQSALNNKLDLGGGTITGDVELKGSLIQNNRNISTYTSGTFMPVFIDRMGKGDISAQYNTQKGSYCINGNMATLSVDMSANILSYPEEGSSIAVGGLPITTSQEVQTGIVRLFNQAVSGKQYSCYITKYDTKLIPMLITDDLVPYKKGDLRLCMQISFQVKEEKKKDN